MSASKVSITANPSMATRRRAVEKKPIDFVETNNLSAAAAASPVAENAKLTVGDASMRGEMRDVVEQVRKALPNSTAAARRPSNSVRKSKPERPRWETVVRVFLKNLALVTVVIGWIYMAKELTTGRRNRTAIDDVVPVLEGDNPRIEELVAKIVTNRIKMVQAQIDVIDSKIGNEIGSVRREINEKIEAVNVDFTDKFKELDGRTKALDDLRSELEGKMEKWLSKEELNQFFEEFKREKGEKTASLDDLRLFAKELVEKEIEIHAADGLGRVDFALASGGGYVLKHSEPYLVRKGSRSSWLSLTNGYRVHSDSQKMLRPSFGEPGQCFALKGNRGYVEIKLRTAILPEAITLEHVAQTVAYDRSSAPKDCRVSGWMQGQDLSAVADTEKMFLLTDITYDLEKSNIQTFDVDSSCSTVVDTIRFDFISNHGSPTHTCIYRIRVHGHEPNSISLAMQS